MCMGTYIYSRFCGHYKIIHFSIKSGLDDFEIRDITSFTCCTFPIGVNRKHLLFALNTSELYRPSALASLFICTILDRSSSFLKVKNENKLQRPHDKIN